MSFCFISTTDSGEINEGQARVILQKNTTQGRITLWKKILREKMSVRKVEASVSKQSKWQKQLENQDQQFLIH